MNHVYVFVPPKTAIVSYFFIKGILSDEAGLQYVSLSDLRSLVSTEAVNTMQLRFESGSRAVL